MRRFFLPLLLAAAPGAAAPPTPQPPLAPADGASGIAPERCRIRSDHAVRQSGKGAAPRKLAELPPADLMLAVYRTENGCPVPTIVRHGIGESEVRPRR